MKASKKALAIVAGPYRFYQMLWLYTRFPELEWSILLLPYGKGDKIVKDLYAKSESLGIFHRIYVSKMVGQDSGVLEQFGIVAKMCLYYLCGRKKTLMRKLVLSQTDKDEFDVFFIGCEYSVIEGAVIGLADEKEVYIFEEGLGDYLQRKKRPSFSVKEIASYLVSKMGYFSPYTLFELEKLSLCVKYASLPDLLMKRNYKEVRPLFAETGENEGQYKELLDRIYTVPKKLIEENDVIFLTAPWDWNLEKKDHYLEKIHQWLTLNYRDKRIMIKKHPRDQEQYEWSDLTRSFLPENIPAEILVEYLQDKIVVMMNVSTTILSLLAKTEAITVFQFDDIHGEYERNLLGKIELLHIEDKIVHI